MGKLNGFDGERKSNGGRELNEGVERGKPKIMKALNNQE